MFRYANANDSHHQLRAAPLGHCTTLTTTTAKNAHSNNHFPSIPTTSAPPHAPASPPPLPNFTHVPTAAVIIVQQNATARISSAFRHPTPTPPRFNRNSPTMTTQDTDTNTAQALPHYPTPPSLLQQQYPMYSSSIGYNPNSHGTSSADVYHQI